MIMTMAESLNPADKGTNWDNHDNLPASGIPCNNALPTTNPVLANAYLLALFLTPFLPIIVVT